ncbi:hypothetical protein AGMMS49574_04590 [Bacteroidia bacterium]|nr:hypothetical protein AGMMS49574_04590 [Bacteroidia bacterium]
MKYKIITVLTTIFLLGSTQVEAQIGRTILGLFGVKDEAVLSSVDKLEKTVVHSAVSAKSSPIIDQYGDTQAISKYESVAINHNKAQDAELSRYRSEKDNWIAEYCKKNGFYDSWVEKYGNGWYESGAKPWFESRNATLMAQGNEDLLPWHLREEPVVNKMEESFNTALLNEIGISSDNQRRGNDWVNARNKYDKQQIVADIAFDAVGEITGQQEFINKFRQQAKILNTYNSDKKEAKTHEEKQAAISKRNIAFKDLMLKTYTEAETRQTESLSERMQIRNKLLQQGYSDPEFTLEVAGSIIAVQKSKNLTEEEKQEWLRGYGFSESPQQIQQYVNEVLSDNYVSSTNNLEAERIKAEEAKRQAEIQKQLAEQKATEERKNAIQQIETAKIEGYHFDETTLSQNQKSKLDEIVGILNKYTDIKVLIVGNTCNIGYKNINLRKGLKRAETGKEYLIEKGISQDRISVDSKGETQPLVQNSSEENRKQNRRIEFIIE